MKQAARRQPGTGETPQQNLKGRSSRQRQSRRGEAYKSNRKTRRQKSHRPKEAEPVVEQQEDRTGRTSRRRAEDEEGHKDRGAKRQKNHWRQGPRTMGTRTQHNNSKTQHGKL